MPPSKGCLTFPEYLIFSRVLAGPELAASGDLQGSRSCLAGLDSVSPVPHHATSQVATEVCSCWPALEFLHRFSQTVNVSKVLPPGLLSPWPHWWPPRVVLVFHVLQSKSLPMDWGGSLETCSPSTGITCWPRLCAVRFPRQRNLVREHLKGIRHRNSFFSFDSSSGSLSLHPRGTAWDWGRLKRTLENSVNHQWA